MIELKRVPKNKIGRLNKNGIKLESLEEKTANYLKLYGFTIDVIRPNSAPKTKNPDFLIAGAIWEIKSPISSKESTVKERFRKAKDQSDRIVFDLRNISKHSERIEKYIIRLFLAPGRVRRLIIIKKDGRVLDIFK